jgi:hypothetical protein
MSSVYQLQLRGSRIYEHSTPIVGVGPSLAE